MTLIFDEYSKVLDNLPVEYQDSSAVLYSIVLACVSNSDNHTIDDFEASSDNEWLDLNSNEIFRIFPSNSDGNQTLNKLYSDINSYSTKFELNSNGKVFSDVTSIDEDDSYSQRLINVSLEIANVKNEGIPSLSGLTLFIRQAMIHRLYSLLFSNKLETIKRINNEVSMTDDTINPLIDEVKSTDDEDIVSSGFTDTLFPLIPSESILTRRIKATELLHFTSLSCNDFFRFRHLQFLGDELRSKLPVLPNFTNLMHRIDGEDGSVLKRRYSRNMSVFIFLQLLTKEFMREPKIFAKYDNWTDELLYVLYWDNPSRRIIKDFWLPKQSCLNMVLSFEANLKPVTSNVNKISPTSVKLSSSTAKTPKVSNNAKESKKSNENNLLFNFNPLDDSQELIKDSIALNTKASIAIQQLANKYTQDRVVLYPAGRSLAVIKKYRSSDDSSVTIFTTCSSILTFQPVVDTPCFNSGVLSTEPKVVKPDSIEGKEPKTTMTAEAKRPASPPKSLSKTPSKKAVAATSTAARSVSPSKSSAKVKSKDLKSKPEPIIDALVIPESEQKIDSKEFEINSPPVITQKKFQLGSGIFTCHTRDNIRITISTSSINSSSASIFTKHISDNLGKIDTILPSKKPSGRTPSYNVVSHFLLPCSLSSDTEGISCNGLSFLANSNGTFAMTPTVRSSIKIEGETSFLSSLLTVKDILSFSTKETTNNLNLGASSHINLISNHLSCIIGVEMKRYILNHGTIVKILNDGLFRKEIIFANGSRILYRSIDEALLTSEELVQWLSPKPVELEFENDFDSQCQISQNIGVGDELNTKRRLLISDEMLYLIKVYQKAPQFNWDSVLLDINGNITYYSYMNIENKSPDVRQFSSEISNDKFRNNSKGIEVKENTESDNLKKFHQKLHAIEIDYLREQMISQRQRKRYQTLNSHTNSSQNQNLNISQSDMKNEEDAELIEYVNSSLSSFLNNYQPVVKLDFDHPLVTNYRTEFIDSESKVTVYKFSDGRVLVRNSTFEDGEINQITFLDNTILSYVLKYDLRNENEASHKDREKYISQYIKQSQNQHLQESTVKHGSKHVNFESISNIAKIMNKKNESLTKTEAKKIASKLLFIRSSNYPTFEIDLDIDEMACKHAKGIEIPINKGGDQVRVRVALNDGTAVVLKYDTRVTASYNGSIKVVRRDRTALSVKDDGKVDFKSSLSWDSNSEIAENFSKDSEESFPRLKPRNINAASANSHSAKDDLYHPDKSNISMTLDSKLMKSGGNDFNIHNVPKEDLNDNKGNTLKNRMTRQATPGKDEVSKDLFLSTKSLDTKFQFDLINLTCKIEDYEFNCFEIDLFNSPLDPRVSLAGEVEGLKPTAVSDRPIDPKVFRIQRDGTVTETISIQDVSDMEKLNHNLPEATKLISDGIHIPSDLSFTKRHLFFTTKNSLFPNKYSFEQVFSQREYLRVLPSPSVSTYQYYNLVIPENEYQSRNLSLQEAFNKKKRKRLSQILNDSVSVDSKSTKFPAVIQSSNSASLLKLPNPDKLVTYRILTESLPLSQEGYSAVKQSIYNWKSFCKTRVDTMEQYAVNDPRSQEQIDEEIKLQSKLRKAYKLMKLLKKKEKEAADNSEKHNQAVMDAEGNYIYQPGAKLQGVDEVDNESVDKIKYTKSNKKAKDLELEARSQENSQSSNKLMNDANISPTKKESSLEANDDLDQSMDELDNDDDEDDDTSEPEEVDELREAEIVAAFDEFCIHVPSKSIAYQDQKSHSNHDLLALDYKSPDLIEESYANKHLPFSSIQPALIQILNTFVSMDQIMMELKLMGISIGIDPHDGIYLPEFRALFERLSDTGPNDYEGDEQDDLDDDEPDYDGIEGGELDEYGKEIVIEQSCGLTDIHNPILAQGSAVEAVRKVKK